MADVDYSKIGEDLEKQELDVRYEPVFDIVTILILY